MDRSLDKSYLYEYIENLKWNIHNQFIYVAYGGVGNWRIYMFDNIAHAAVEFYRRYSDIANNKKKLPFIFGA